MHSENHVINEGPDPPWEGAILSGKGQLIVKYRDTLRSSVQKRTNRSRCRLGCGLGLAQRIVRWGPDPHRKGQFGYRGATVKYGTYCHHLCENG